MFPLSKGRVSKQAHVSLPEGTYEEEHGREAFDGRASHLYRTHLPTAWVAIEGPLAPRAYDLNGLKPADLTDAAGDWQRILFNDEVSIYVSRRAGPMPWFLRDSDGDLCYFVHHGTGVLETDYGPLRYRDGDFLVLPKGTTHRVVPGPRYAVALFAPDSPYRYAAVDVATMHGASSTYNVLENVRRRVDELNAGTVAPKYTNRPFWGAEIVPSPTEATDDEETFLYCIEGRGEYRLPEKGILGRHAIFDPGVLETPEPDPHDEQGEFHVRVKRGDEYTTLTYPFHPLDVVGWQGDLCPLRLNVEDIRPVVSPRYHLPPSVHVTFKSDGFEIGTFAPRPTETGDPEALRVPFFHSNIDKDEVLFYHRGQFFSRAGIGEAFITHHPQGLHHGPQPAALEAGKTKEFADEYAIMVEADTPFERDDALAAVEVEGYSTSWARGLGLIE